MKTHKRYTVRVQCISTNCEKTVRVLIPLVDDIGSSTKEEAAVERAIIKMFGKNAWWFKDFGQWNSGQVFIRSLNGIYPVTSTATLDVTEGW